MSKQLNTKQFSLAYVQFQCQKTFLFPIILFSTQFKYKYTFLFQTIQSSQTVLIQTIQFSISMQFSYI